MEILEGEIFGTADEEELPDVFLSELEYSLHHDDPSIVNAVLEKTDVAVSAAARVLDTDSARIHEPERYPDCVIEDPECDLLVLIDCKWGESFADADQYRELQQQAPQSTVVLVFVADVFYRLYERVPQITFREIYANLNSAEMSSPARHDELISKLDTLGYADTVRLPTETEIRGAYLDRLLDLVVSHVEERIGIKLQTERNGDTAHRKRTAISFEGNGEPSVTLAIAHTGHRYDRGDITQPTFVILSGLESEDAPHPRTQIPLSADADVLSIEQALQTQMNEIVQCVVQHVADLHE